VESSEVGGRPTITHNGDVAAGELENGACVSPASSSSSPMPRSPVAEGLPYSTDVYINELHSEDHPTDALQVRARLQQQKNREKAKQKRSDKRHSKKKAGSSAGKGGNKSGRGGRSPGSRRNSPGGRGRGRGRGRGKGSPRESR
jgi:hypothetical protein